MSFGANGSSQKSQSQSSSFYDPTQTGIVNDYARGVVTAANDPNSALSYKPYGGPGLSFGDPTQLQALTGYAAPKAVGTGYDPAMMRTGQVVGDTATLMNPFTSGVIDTTNADLSRDQAIAGAGADAQATAAGAFGGSRSAVLRNLSDDSYIRAKAATDASLRQAGYTQAQGAALGIGQGNQAAANQGLQFGAAAQNAASLANQQADIASANQRLQAIGMTAEQAQALYGSDWAQYVNSQQTPEAIQALKNQAMSLVPTAPLQQSTSSGKESSFGFKAEAPK